MAARRGVRFLRLNMHVRGFVVNLGATRRPGGTEAHPAGREERRGVEQVAGGGDHGGVMPNIHMAVRNDEELSKLLGAVTTLFDYDNHRSSLQRRPPFSLQRKRIQFRYSRMRSFLICGASVDSRKVKLASFFFNQITRVRLQSDSRRRIFFSSTTQLRGKPREQEAISKSRLPNCDPYWVAIQSKKKLPYSLQESLTESSAGIPVSSFSNTRGGGRIRDEVWSFTSYYGSDLLIGKEKSL